MEKIIQIDLTIDNHPLLIGRLWPVKLHHWTRDQFAAFLKEHRYPVNTWGDQQENHRQAVIRAGVKGFPIPQAVLDEDASIAADIKMHTEADKSWANIAQRIKDLIEDFEMRCGYTTSQVRYRETLKYIMRSMLKPETGRPLSIDKNAMCTKFEGQALTLRILEGRLPTHGHFGSYGGRKKQVHINYGYGTISPITLHQFDWDLAEQLLIEMLKAKEVTYDDIWYWTGTGWGPRLSTIHVVDSTQRHREVEHVAG